MRSPVELGLEAGGPQTVQLTEDGAFRFPVRVPDGTAYHVTLAAGCRSEQADGTVSGDVSLSIVCPGVTELGSLQFSQPFDAVPRFDSAAPDYLASTRHYLLEDPISVTSTGDASVGIDVAGSGQATATVPWGMPRTRFDIVVSHPLGHSRTYRFGIDAVLKQESIVKAPSPLAGASFGGKIGTTSSTAVALDGDALVVGAPNEDAGKGAVYVFRRAGNTFAFEQRIGAPVSSPSDGFGSAVAISGTTLVVGAPAIAARPGAAYTFVYTSTWSFEATLSSAAASNGDAFGAAVAIHGDTAIVGAPKPSGTGAAYRFARSGAWGAASPLPGAVASGAFGASVAMSQDTAVVGAPFETSGRGAIYVFNGPSWTAGPRLAIAAPVDNDFLGWSVSTSGDLIAAGAPQRDLGTADQGAAYVFHRGSGTWASVDTVLSPDAAADNRFGWAVAVDRNHLVAGAKDESSTSRGIDSTPQFGAGLQIGAAHVLRFDGASWLPNHHYIKASDASGGDLLGTSVAIRGDTFVVGAPSQNASANDSGAVYVFR